MGYCHKNSWTVEKVNPSNTPKLFDQNSQVTEIIRRFSMLWQQNQTAKVFLKTRFSKFYVMSLEKKKQNQRRVSFCHNRGPYHKNQSKSMDRFLYDTDLCHERVKVLPNINDVAFLRKQPRLVINYFRKNSYHTWTGS